VLAKRPSLDKIKAKLEEIQEMSEEELKVKMVRLSRRPTLKLKRPKVKQKTKISKWFPNASERALSRRP
jgi:hypothetical protein